MKKLNLYLILAILSGLVIFSSCDKDEESPEMNEKVPSEMTISEFASENDDFSILVEALVKTDLVSTLDGAGDFTVFAPDNTAFNELFAVLNVDGIADIAAEDLKPILLYHVLGEGKSSTMIMDGYYSSLSPAQGRTLSMYISAGMGVSINGAAEVITADVKLSNGYIHAIDAVLLPPTIVDIASKNSDFETLVSAVVGANLAETLSDPMGTFTVFAPTDMAFEALGGNLPSDLSPILLYHVLGSPVYSDEISSSIVNSLNQDNSEIVVEVTDQGVFLNGTAQVVATDIVGTNGVIHVIDQVILPISDESILDIAMGLDDFSSLVAALAKANLASTFMMEGDYTVFAPTNDAFAVFLSSLGVSFEDLTREDLLPILTYHVVGAKALSGSLATGYINSIYAAQEGYPVSMLVEVGDGVTLNGTISVTNADVEASNGVIHVIDAVLNSTSVVDIAINNSNFTQLVEAVVKAGLAETLSGPGPFTVFAPTDAAFEQLYSELGVGGIADLSAEALVPILQYHVVSGNVLSTDLSDGNVPTLNGDITFSLSEVVSINGDTEVIAVDIQGTNGVVHVINKVLLPQ
jgi:transforming growth factor-beta-induced protein